MRVTGHNCRNTQLANTPTVHPVSLSNSRAARDAGGEEKENPDVTLLQEPQLGKKSKLTLLLTATFEMRLNPRVPTACGL